MNDQSGNWVEARVVINGQQLTRLQAMTVRVAVTVFLLEMRRPGALGIESPAEQARHDYLEAGRDIMHLIHEVRGQ